MIHVVIKPNKLMGQIGKSKVQINYHGKQPSYCSGDTWCIVDLTNLTNLKTSYKVLSILSEIAIFGTVKSKPMHFFCYRVPIDES